MLHLTQKPLNLKDVQIVLTIYYSSRKAVVFGCVIVSTNIFVVFCSMFIFAYMFIYIVFMFIEYTDTLIFLAFEVK